MQRPTYQAEAKGLPATQQACVMDDGVPLTYQLMRGVQPGLKAAGAQPVPNRAEQSGTQQNRSMKNRSLRQHSARCAQPARLGTSRQPWQSRDAACEWSCATNVGSCYSMLMHVPSTAKLTIVVHNWLTIPHLMNPRALPLRHI
jgi:hypothetical protein